METGVPDTLLYADVHREMLRLYQLKLSHVFILVGNVNDFIDLSGNRRSVLHCLNGFYDINVFNDLRSKDQQFFAANPKVNWIVGTYQLSNGLQFAHERSREIWSQVDASSGNIVHDLNHWFGVTMSLRKTNLINRQTGTKEVPEYGLTLVFPQAENVFPSGDADPVWIDAMLSWASDETLGDRARIVLIADNPALLAEPIRRHARICAVEMSMPTETQRLQWITGFDQKIRQATAARPLQFGNREIRGVELNSNYSFKDLAHNTEGLMLRQIEDIFMRSWWENKPIDQSLVSEFRTFLCHQATLKSVD